MNLFLKKGEKRNLQRLLFTSVKTMFFISIHCYLSKINTRLLLKLCAKTHFGDKDTT